MPRVARKLNPTTADAVVAGVGSITRTRRMADVFCDGTADDVQIQALLDAGANVRLEGNFGLAASLVRKFPGQKITGAGIDATVLTLAAGVNDFAIKTALPSGLDRLWGGGVGSLTIDGNMNNQSAGGGIKIDQCYKAFHHDLRVLNTKGYAIQIIGVSSMYCAYNVFQNLSCAVGLGHGIVVDSYSEFNEFYGVNSSFFQGGTPATNQFDDVTTVAGIGFYAKGGLNTVVGGHLDKNRVGWRSEFSLGNKFYGYIDNSWDCAISLKGAQKNSLFVGIGRCDPGTGTAGGTLVTDPAVIGGLYGTRRAINVQGDCGANRIYPTYYADNSPPSNPPGTAQLGGWLYHVAGSSGEGAEANGGINAVIDPSPSGLAIRWDGASSRVKTRTGAATLTLGDLGYYGVEAPVHLCDASGGAFTLTLPNALKAGIYRASFVNYGGSNNVTIAAGASDTLSSGALTPGQTGTWVAVSTSNGGAVTWRRER